MDGMNRILIWLPLPRRLQAAGWGVLLVSVILLLGTIFGRAIPWGVIVVVAGAATLLVPAVSADLVAAGVICLGLYATVLTGWIVLAFFQVIGGVFANNPALLGLNPFSTAVMSLSGAYLSLGWTAVLLDVLKSAVILGFGVWLVPRTIGVHSGLAHRNAALASRVTQLAETRGAAVETAAAELRRLGGNPHDRAAARRGALRRNT